MARKPTQRPMEGLLSAPKRKPSGKYPNHHAFGRQYGIPIAKQAWHVEGTADEQLNHKRKLIGDNDEYRQKRRRLEDRLEDLALERMFKL